MRDGAPLDPLELGNTIHIGSVDDPYPYLAAARARGPVQAEYPLPDDGLELGDSDDQWISVVGHDEVVAVLRDNETYSSTVLGELMGPMLGHTVVAMDEPEHRQHRSLVARAFRPKLLAHWEDELVRRVVDELLDAFVADGRADLVRQLTFGFPVRVIARILGLPEEDYERFQRLSLELISVLVDWERGFAASEALHEYFAGQVADRRADPQDDLISDLIETEVDGQRLSDEEIFDFLRLLLPAGVETTYRSVGNLLFALLTHPDQLDAVTSEPELRRGAIEEGLRWEALVVVIPRRALRDTTLAGFDVPAGTGLNVFLASANRDEQHYVDADRFDVRRNPEPHLTFGSGPHMCLGMHLARMETRVALELVLERLPRMRLDPDAPAPRIFGTAFRSPDALPVRFA